MHIIRFRRLANYSVSWTVRRELGKGYYKKMLSGRSDAAALRERLRVDVCEQLKLDRVRLLRETLHDYRVEISCSFRWPGLTFVMLGLAIGLVIHSAMTHTWKPGALGAGAIAGVVVAVWYQTWKMRSGHLFSERLPQPVHSLLRVRRIPTGQFQFIVQTRLSFALNKMLSADEVNAMAPEMRPDALSRDTLNPVSSLNDIRDRVLQRPDITLGLSGSRGVGKTTIMNYLRRFEAEIGRVILIRLPAPSVKVDLARFMLDAVANKLAGEKPTSWEKRLKKRSHWIVLFSAVLLVAALYFAGISSLRLSMADRGVLSALAENGQISGNLADTEWLEHLELLAAYALLLAAVVCFSLGLLVNTWSSSAPGLRRLTALANDIRDSLTFEKETTQQANLGLSLRLGSGGISTLNRLKERDLLQADIYAVFERLVQQYRQVTGKRILLLIDELDRYELQFEGNEKRVLGEALNQLKPFFLVPGVSAIMSISTQAIRQFENREAESLGVLDSTYDETVEIPNWDENEIMTFLSYVVTGLSEPAQRRLAELSKGRPREADRLAWLFCRYMQKPETPPIEIAGFLQTGKGRAILAHVNARRDRAPVNARRDRAPTVHEGNGAPRFSQSDCLDIIAEYVTHEGEG